VPDPGERVAAAVVALAAHLVALPVAQVTLLAQRVLVRRYWLSALRDADTCAAHLWAHLAHIRAARPPACENKAIPHLVAPPCGGHPSGGPARPRQAVARAAICKTRWGEPRAAASHCRLRFSRQKLPDLPWPLLATLAMSLARAQCGCHKNALGAPHAISPDALSCESTPTNRRTSNAEH
jgi:hypothetical protein